MPAVEDIPRCRSCGAPIIWMSTSKGRTMPVNRNPDYVQDKVFVPGKHVSHFATCPNAVKHRKARPAAWGA